MSLVEFLSASGAKTWRERALAVLYWHAHFKDERALSSAQIKASMQAARVPKARQANIADVMNKAGALVDSSARAGSVFGLSPRPAKLRSERWRVFQKLNPKSNTASRNSEKWLWQ